MAALTDFPDLGLGPVGGEVPDAPPGSDQSVELLVGAAAALPDVVGDGPARCADVHAALYAVACGLGVGSDRSHRLRMADEAFDRFAAYLIWAGQAEPARRGSDPVRRWLIRSSAVEAQCALAAAAGYWRRRRERIPEPS